MTPAQRQLIERVLLSEPHSFGLAPNVLDAIRAQGDALAAAEARIAVLETAQVTEQT